MKIGLVLAGGGARGAYQIGVWKGLKEIGIDKYISVRVNKERNFTYNRI